MLATKNNPKKYAPPSRARQSRRGAWRSGRKPMRSARAGEVLDLNSDNFLRICGLNGLMAGEVPGLIERSKVAVYRALLNPAGFPVVFSRLEEILPKRRVPSDD